MSAAPSVPGDDPLDEAVLSADDLSTLRSWLTSARFQCTHTVPIVPDMVAGLLAAYEAAVAGADTLPPAVRATATEVAREERDETMALALLRLEGMQDRIDSAVSQLRGFAEHNDGLTYAVLHRVINTLEDPS